MAFDTSEELVEVVAGLAVSKKVTVVAEDLDGYDIELQVVPLDGRLVAQEVTVRRRDDGAPVTGEALRAIPVASLVRQSVSVAMTRQEVEGATVMEVGVLLPEAIEEAKKAGPTDDTLALVAHVYRVALALGDRPTRAVETTFQLSRSTAGRWVSLARERGFLGHALAPGRASG